MWDPISKQDQMDVVLDGHLEEYNHFVMMIYGLSDSLSLYDIEAFLYDTTSTISQPHQVSTLLSTNRHPVA